MAFSENLQFLRTRREQTQEQLAEVLDVSRQSVSKWESGQSYPEMDTILRICDLYQVDLDTLLRGSVEDSLVEDTARYDHFMTGHARRMALAIGGIIAGIGLAALFNARGIPEMFIAAFLLAVLAVCAVVIVASALQEDNFRKAHPVIADFYTETDKNAFRQKFVWLISGGVGAILLDVALFILFFSVFPERAPYDSYGTSLFMLILAGAVSALVYAGMQEDKYKIDHYNRDNNPTPEVKRRKGIIGSACGALMVLATAIYVALGLALDLWDTAWWVFPVGGILCAVICIVLDPYRGED